jgi:hypothetical protein
MQTARQLADLVQIARRDAWEKSDPTDAIVATEKLGATDLHVIHDVVMEAGYTGDEIEPMSRHVAKLVVGQVEALADNMPATGAD